jgi:mannan endo-1,4-beta-mannosidase
MNHKIYTMVGIFLLCSLLFQCREKKLDGFKHFVTAANGRLMDGGRELRFISFNIPNLHYIEDNLPFMEINPWRLPNEFEIRDALASVRQMGGQVVRTYTLSVKSASDADDIPRHVLAPGRFNEEAFTTLDRVLQIANEQRVRLIIPFVDNWKWWGGIGEYAAFRSKSPNEFWTDPQIKADFKQTIDFVLNRVNSLTGVRYKDDKTVLAWETGNELGCPPEWTAEIAAFIKSVDPHHLVMDGFHSQHLRASSLDDPNIDVVTTHHYEKDADAMIRNIRQNIELVSGRKPYIVGEFGFINTEGVQRVLSTIIDSRCSGALIWSLRFHDRDGGFYWHSEPFGGNLFKAYHWPGFPSGEPFDETSCLNLMREKAFAICNLPLPALEPPQPPTLLPISSVAEISWQGSTGASYYIIERSETGVEPWTTLTDRVTDADVQYRPLYNDGDVALGKTYYYRVTAVNSAGASAPSNIAEALPASCFTLIDECADWQHLYSRQGALTLKNDEARKAKEDSHRFRGEAGDAVVYHCRGSIQDFRAYTFSSGQAKDFLFFVSTDGKNWLPVAVIAEKPLTDAGAYNYTQPTLFSSANIAGEYTFLKIVFPALAELSRVEINYGN